ncbi:hypothetical protein [Neopusillimonas aromaticivorans]|uniref:hypothetical protein n=1 Tax=Neopusillimonas aromaticivorans TaxID=2979868 RepID=UPI0025974B53|nr:hypothetical protein [Neopusillimonas aromaticivorans]WJJ94703.1 hypothetical protein N7E01_07300 [Neopusillimonas aromaticivorans]
MPGTAGNDTFIGGTAQIQAADVIDGGADLTAEHAREFFSLMQDWGHVMYWLEAERK